MGLRVDLRAVDGEDRPGPRRSTDGTSELMNAFRKGRVWQPLRMRCHRGRFSPGFGRQLIKQQSEKLQVALGDSILEYMNAVVMLLPWFLGCPQADTIVPWGNKINASELTNDNFGYQKRPHPLRIQQTDLKPTSRKQRASTRKDIQKNKHKLQKTTSQQPRGRRHGGMGEALRYVRNLRPLPFFNHN